jgi:hypothetical protein
VLVLQTCTAANEVGGGRVVLQPRKLDCLQARDYIIASLACTTPPIAFSAQMLCLSSGYSRLLCLRWICHLRTHHELEPHRIAILSHKMWYLRVLFAAGTSARMTIVFSSFDVGQWRRQAHTIIDNKLRVEKIIVLKAICSVQIHLFYYQLLVSLLLAQSRRSYRHHIQLFWFSGSDVSSILRFMLHQFAGVVEAWRVDCNKWYFLW